jgi:hypothetical protein
MLSHAFTKFEPKGMGIRSVNLWTRSWMGEHWEKTIQFKEPAMNTRGALSRIKLILENSPQLGLIEQNRHENYWPGPPQRAPEKPVHQRPGAGQPAGRCQTVGIPAGRSSVIPD